MWHAAARNGCAIAAMSIPSLWCSLTKPGSRRTWPRGQRLKAKLPHRRWTTMTFLAARRHDRVEAPWLVDGPINGERFRLYVEQVLTPTLCPTDIVVMNNLGSHNSKAVRRAIHATGAKLFLLPKYSPDLKPIEMLFAKLKHWRRHAQGRSLEAICHALAETLKTITAAECRNYFVQTGYDPT